MIYLNTSNNKKEEYYYTSFSMKTLYISYYYGLDHICKTVYLPEKDLYITNNHCLSSDWQCFGTKIGSQDSEEFCDKVLYTEKYYDLTVFKTKGEKYKSNVVKPNLDITNIVDDRTDILYSL